MEGPYQDAPVWKSWLLVVKSPDMDTLPIKLPMVNHQVRTWLNWWLLAAGRKSGFPTRCFHRCWVGAMGFWVGYSANYRSWWLRCYVKKWTHDAWQEKWSIFLITLLWDNLIRIMIHHDPVFTSSAGCHAWLRTRLGSVYQQTLQTLNFSCREAAEFLSIYLCLGCAAEALPKKLAAPRRLLNRMILQTGMRIHIYNHSIAILD